MPRDPFFQLDTTPPNQAATDCEKTCPLANGGGFCGARIHPDCLHIGPDHSVRVSLSTVPEAWFTMLRALGDVLHLARNSLAVLGQLGPLPELTDWRNPVLPRDCSSSLMPNLAQYASLWATREPALAGTAYGLEARDLSGQAFQKVILTAPAHRELFEQFVTDYQSPVAEAGSWFSPNHAASTHRCRALTKRVPFLRSQLVKGATCIRQLPVGAIPRLLAQAAKARLPLRTTHYNRALNCAAVWTPSVSEPTSSERDGMEFIHGDGVGLHVYLPAVAGVWLWQGRCHCCDKQHWTVEVADGADQVGLAITVGEERLEPEWRKLLIAVST